MNDIYDRSSQIPLTGDKAIDDLMIAMENMEATDSATRLSILKRTHEDLVDLLNAPSADQQTIPGLRP